MQKKTLVTSLESLRNPAYVKTLSTDKVIGCVAIGTFMDFDTCHIISVHVMDCIMKIMGHFNVPGMSTAQVGDCAALLMEKYPDWSVEDFAIFSKSVRMGNINGREYEKSFNRLDPEMIMRFAAVYYLEKLDSRDREIERKKREAENEAAKLGEALKPDEGLNHPYLGAMIEKFEDMKQNQKPEYHGDPYVSALKDQLSTESKPIDISDPHEAMKSMFETVLNQQGIEVAEIELEMYIRKWGQNGFTMWAQQMITEALKSKTI